MLFNVQMKDLNDMKAEKTRIGCKGKLLSYNCTVLVKSVSQNVFYYIWQTHAVK